MPDIKIFILLLMKIKSSSKQILFLILLVIVTATCSKEEDSEKIRKEKITSSLNSDISADTLESFVLWMQNMGTRFALSDNHRDVAVKIKNRFINMGYPDARLDSFEITKTYREISYQQWQYNVIASIEGTAYPDSVCIIGGHYDNILKTGDPFSIVPGANDNASGVAAAMEIARVMKKNGYLPRNTIQFIAFGSEEIWSLGKSCLCRRGQKQLQKNKNDA